MRKYNIKLITLVMLIAFLFNPLLGCRNYRLLKEFENRLTEESEKLHLFKNGHNASLFQIAFWSNGYPFNCRWKTDNISFDEDGMNITLLKKDEIYYGGEYRTYKKYGYGFYSVSMKPIKCDGVISSFFTYTYNPWDEIDIEFLGDDTTSVQFNYYTNGKGNHEYHYKLGFDASEDFHEYAFWWTEDWICWYVDGKPVHVATEDIPSHPQQIMANVWNVHPDFKSWAGLFTGDNLPVSAEYEWFSYSAS